MYQVLTDLIGHYELEMERMRAEVFQEECLKISQQKYNASMTVEEFGVLANKNTEARMPDIKKVNEKMLFADFGGSLEVVEALREQERVLMVKEQKEREELEKPVQMESVYEPKSADDLTLEFNSKSNPDPPHLGK